MIPQPSFITAQFIVSALTIVIVIHVILVACAYCIYFERKTSAWMQDRVGPNRCGFDFGLPFLSFLKGMYGLGQSLADGIKFMLKEDYTPRHVDKALFTLAPCVVVIPALIGFGIINWGGTFVMPDFTIPLLNWHIAGGPVAVAGIEANIGVVYLLAVGSLGIYGVALGGWASNNKYSMLGGLRASSQMLSYEIPMGLSLLCVLLTVGSLLPSQIIAHQVSHGWLVLAQPLVAALFFICVLAECNRAPFDNAECEQELVGGYHTEYSSMRFALFFLAEYAHMITGSALFATLFLGGWHLPFVPGLQPEDTGLIAVLMKFGVLFTKAALLVGFMMLVRWTLPRLRFDQVMQAAWQSVIPVAILLVLANAVLVYLGGWWTTLPATLATNLALAALFVGLQALFPRPSNAKLALAGSRFSPMAGERVSTAPGLAVAREDDPGRTAATTAVV